MKLKSSIWIVLVVVVVVAIGFRLHRPRPMLPLPKPVARAAAVRPPRILIHPMKMATVKALAKKKSAFTLSRADWSDAELIADGQATYASRLEAISRLPFNLTEADWRILRKFLLSPDPADSGQQGQVVKNELMDRLCGMQPPPKDLDKVFAAIYQNLLQDEVIRDYAVQHLATLDGILAGNGGKGNAREVTEDQKVLWNALDETGDSIAGTALLGLMRLSGQQNAGVDQSRIAAVALRLAHDDTAGELTQITAYQVCAQMEVQDALPAIESAAQNGQTLSVQISAIGALGLLGGSSDVPLLQKLLRENPERLQLPVQTAINRIEQRRQRHLPAGQTAHGQSS